MIVSKGRHVLGKLSRNGDKSAPRNCEAALTWELCDEDGKLEFAAQGEVWNHLKTDIVQGGQCVDTLADLFKRDKLAQRIRETWSRYHLNDMNAGTPEQSAALDRAEAEAVALLRSTNSPAGCFYSDGRVNWYVAGDYITGEKGAGRHGWACAVLKQAGLYEVPVTDELRASALGGLPDGAETYRYGAGWLYRAIPDDVLALIRRGFQDETGPALVADEDETGEPDRDLIAEAGLSIVATFVPWSQSRNKDEKSPSLNWRVTLQRKGVDVLTADYMAGSAHCPAYGNRKHGRNGSMNMRIAIRSECETGREYLRSWQNGKPIRPNERNVISALLNDASAINDRSFADWRNEYGYSADSIEARGLYDQCIAHALAIRGAVGGAMFESLMGGNA